MKPRHLLVLFALLLPMAAFAQNAATHTAIDYFTTYYRAFDLDATDVADLAVSDAYTSRRSGTTHVYLRQRFGGIEIVDANYTVNVDRDGEIFHKAGRFETHISDRVDVATPSITAVAAAEIVARNAGLTPGAFTVISTEGTPNQATLLSDGGVARSPVEARLVYRPDQTELRLSWQILLYERDAEHYWLAHVDAVDGSVLYQYDQVVHDNWMPEGTEVRTAATVELDPSFYVAPMVPRAVGGPQYRAFALPDESPNHSTPPAPADGRTLHANPADATASPFGWHDTNGSPGAESTLTTGNNVDAHKGATRPDCTAALNCDFAADFSVSPVNHVPAATANNFYLSNVLHDIMYHYGFDEAAGNFQENNYGNGGLGSDAVDAVVQSPGNCNATMGTPPDGSNPTMSMFLCTIGNPDTDSDYDTGVLFHEYTHGTSNRLTGGPSTTSCLNNSEQMGEGWSDYVGFLLTIEPGDMGTDSRGAGTYFLGQPTTGPGVRLSPYSTDFSVNNYTYGRTTSMFGSHDIGFVWATILWEVTWEMVDAFGLDANVYDENSTAGNNVMLQLVTEGMKLQPCSPGFVDGRDAIIQADINMYGGAHLLQLWTGFARRGLGEHADQGSSSTNSDNVEEFTIPDPVPVELVGFTAAVDGNDVVLNWDTASETNNAGFEVQLLTEDSGYDVLGFVEGNGTTTEAQAYSFRAIDVPVGSHTFRLKQIDFDGAFEYSGETEVTVGVVGSYVLSDVYPNPFNPQAQFTLAVANAQNVRIAVYDVMGRQVATLHDGQLDANETYSFTVNGTNLASGAYIIRVTGETFADTKRITLLK